MQTIGRAMANRGSAGEALPPVFSALEAKGFRFRRGQITLIAAAPGGGKSAMSLALAVALNVGTIYASADSDEFTQGTRVIAMKSGDLLETIQLALEPAAPAGPAAYYEEFLANLGNVRFEFTPDPSTDDIEELAWAFAMLFGEWPSLIVVDNLSDLWSGEGGDDSGEYSGYDRGLKFLKSLARTTGACVIVLHHLIGSKESGDAPAGLADLKGKVGKIPESVLTLWRPGSAEDHLLGVAIVKNRGGKASADGSYACHLRFIPERMTVR